MDIEKLKHDSRGKFAGRDICGQELHDLTPDNVYTAPNGKRTCKKCRLMRQRKYRVQHPIPRKGSNSPWDIGTCMSGQHKWNSDNYKKNNKGTYFCVPCKRETWTRFKQNNPIITHCIVKGCESYTYRQENIGYICGKHRDNPPSWIISAKLRIEGTKIYAA